jgi:solute carrier family 35, member F1/2
MVLPETENTAFNRICNNKEDAVFCPSQTFGVKRPRSSTIRPGNENNSMKSHSTNIWQSIRSKRQHMNPQDGVLFGTSRNKWISVLFGQLIALLSSSMNASSFTLINHFGIDTQFFQMLGMYLLLSLHLVIRRQEPVAFDEDDSLYHLPGTKLRLRVPWWIYLCISLFDVLPNVLTLLSFRYTSLTSTTLLGSLTVPSTMIFSRYILAKSFGMQQYVGVCLCLLGGTVTVWSDRTDSSTTSSTLSNTHYPTSVTDAQATPLPSIVGDILAVTAAAIYGLGDTVAEYSVKHIDRQEYLGMLGMFGMIQTIFFSCWLERDAILGMSRLAPTTQLQIAAVFVWYSASVFAYYMVEARFLMVSDATLLNMSLQASNLWAILFSVMAYHTIPPWLFHVALLLVVSGVFVYQMSGRHGDAKDTTKDPETLALVRGDSQQANGTPYDAISKHPPTHSMAC